jgi:hypothetical protein
MFSNHQAFTLRELPAIMNISGALVWGLGRQLVADPPLKWRSLYYGGALIGGANKKMTENVSQKINDLAAMSRLSIAEHLLI